MKEERERRRTGTIARLPRAVRDEVNRMLDDGESYKRIIEWLAENGHPGVNEGHLSEWKQGGYQDWMELQLELRRQEKVHELSNSLISFSESNFRKTSNRKFAAIWIAAACVLFPSFAVAILYMLRVQ